MKRVEAPSYPISIFIGGSGKEAHLWARGYCDDVGLCVTVTETRYVYTGGLTFGVIVGLINYPRFPLEPEQLWERAEALAAILCRGLKQESYTIQAPDKTVWFSHRAEDNSPSPKNIAAQGDGAVSELCDRALLACAAFGVAILILVTPPASPLTWGIAILAIGVVMVERFAPPSSHNESLTTDRGGVNG